MAKLICLLFTSADEGEFKHNPLPENIVNTDSIVDQNPTSVEIMRLLRLMW